MIKTALVALLILTPLSAPMAQTLPGGSADGSGTSAGAEEWLQALWDKGEEAFAEGRLEDARRAFQELLSLDPENGRTWNYMGGISFAEKDFYQALVRFKRAVVEEPKDSRIFNNLATTYDHLGQYANAIENYLLAISLDPEYPVPYRNLGAIYAYKVRDRKLAIRYWGQYLELTSDVVEAREIEEELRLLEEEQQ